jgi:CubicO group peptidase (beta-lactamase class C family)
LAHTSGIPDYFQQKDDKGNSLENEIKKGNDRFWTFEELVEMSKNLKPLFAPSQKGKAHYSDTNFQLLARIIENITDKPISENFEQLIIQPLGLTKTYLYQDIADTRPRTLYFKNRELHIPKAMNSFGPDGGMVSTSAEMLQFIEAFFEGRFFPQTYIDKLKTWNKIFFPLESGIGLHRIKLPLIFDPFGKIPELIGHSGLSGALAYHSPQKDLYITGTVNQVAFPDISFRTVIRIIQKTISK